MKSLTLACLWPKRQQMGFEKHHSKITETVHSEKVIKGMMCSSDNFHVKGRIPTLSIAWAPLIFFWWASRLRKRPYQVSQLYRGNYFNGKFRPWHWNAVVWSRRITVPSNEAACVICGGRRVTDPRCGSPPRAVSVAATLAWRPRLLQFPHAWLLRSQHRQLRKPLSWGAPLPSPRHVTWI